MKSELFLEVKILRILDFFQFMRPRSAFEMEVIFVIGSGIYGLPFTLNMLAFVRRFAVRCISSAAAACSIKVVP